MRDKNKTLLFQRIIPSYRVAFFEALGKKIDLTVCYSKEKKNSSLKNSNNYHFSTIQLKRIYFSKSETFLFQFSILKTLFKIKPKIIISEGSISFITLWLLFIFRPIFKYRLLIWTHGIKNSEIKQPFSNFAGKLRLKLLNKADAIIIYTIQRKTFLQKYIKNKNKLFVANNTLNTNELNDFYFKFEKIGKNQIKKDLKLHNNLNFIFVGRLIPEKKIDLLIQAFSTIEGKANLIIIGDGPEKDKLKKLANNSSEIKFLDAIYDPELIGKYLFASDLMISPGYIGLAIVHAFGYGCPVLTFANGINSYHSPEFEYLKNNYNGIIVSDKNLNFEKIIDLNFENLSKNARTTIENDANIKNMLLGFENAINYALNLKS